MKNSWSRRTSASLAGSGKVRADQRKPRNIGRQQFHFVSRRQHDPQPPILREPLVAITLPLRQGQDERRSRIALGFRQVQPVIVDYATVTQQPARHTLFP